jgi:predicted protein tyrosine phosphatase
MNVLFVCTEAISRSPTAARIFSELAKKKKVKVSVKYAGVDNHCKNHITKQLVKWADKIYAMESFHKDWIIDMCPESEKKIIVLDIADFYMKDEPGLVEILTEKLKKEI